MKGRTRLIPDKYQELAGSVLDPEESQRIRDVVMTGGTMPGKISFAGV
jgi:hypothetical protein